MKEYTELGTATAVETIWQSVFKATQFSPVTSSLNIVSKLHFDSEGQNFLSFIACHRSLNSLLRCSFYNSIKTLGEALLLLWTV